MTHYIKVRNSGLVKLTSIDDFPDGTLLIGENLKNISFRIKRFFIIRNLYNKESIRGKHAHKKLIQVIFCINGYFTLSLDDGRCKQKILMNNPRTGVILGKMLWSTMDNFSKDCVILVLASDYYRENDYIRNYDTYRKLLNKKFS